MILIFSALFELELTYLFLLLFVYFVEQWSRLLRLSTRSLKDARNATDCDLQSLRDEEFVVYFFLLRFIFSTFLCYLRLHYLLLQSTLRTLFLI